MDRSQGPDTPESLAARLRKKYGESVDPEVSLRGAEPRTPTRATRDLLKRLSEHGMKSPRYRLEGEVARGGMGAILRVWEENLRRPLAMKVVLGRDDTPGSGASSQVDIRMLARFLEEAQVTGQLDHPGIVPVHELGLDADGRAYFTMKLVKGRDLRAIFDLVFEGKEGWNETRALGVILRVCEAMAYAHAKGVIHRDLKPANVMVGDFGEVFVMDWGLARVLGRKDAHDLRLRPQGSPNSQLANVETERGDEREDAPYSPLVTVDGDVMGTPAYMPPEQARGEIEKLSARSDVYSIGAMLYHLLARQMPFVTPADRIPKRNELIPVLEGPPRPLHEINRDAPAEIVAICEKAMARDANDRYSDTIALAEDLRAYLEDRVVAAYETGAGAELRKWVARNKGLASATGAAVFILVVGLLVSSSLFVTAKKERIRADAKATEAVQERTLAQQRADDVLSLSAIQDLQDLTVRADALWPAHPENMGRYEAWLEDARALIDGRPSDPTQSIKAKPSLKEHQRKLAEIEQRGRSEPARAAAKPGGEGAQQVTWWFDSSEDRWWHAQLTKLVADLTSFSDPKTGLFSAGIAAKYGWGIGKRLEFARTIRERSVTGAEARSRWSEAIAAIRDRALSPLYDGAVIAPQLGLLPIGRDPLSGLWEFAHLQTGEPAEREMDGELRLREETGLVFVLIPGGRFRMGAQNTDPLQVNFDPQASEDESPVQEVTLSPYFLSKYEMTQAQWIRSTGRNPSGFGSDSSFSDSQHNVLHPVEQVSWNDCTEVLRRLSLQLPTEAQWEYGARAGTQSPWWTGKEKDSIEGAANLADAAAKRSGGPSSWVYEDWLDDGYGTHAPIGTYRPNPFGLHDVIGNVWEWCRDEYGTYRLPVHEGDGERQVSASGNRVTRGGSFDFPAVNARSASRGSSSPELLDNPVGLRPARSMEPP